MTITKEITQIALKQCQDFIYNSSLMNFDWSNENKQYLTIKIKLIFDNYVESLTKDFLSDKTMVLGVSHNKVSLREFPDRDDNTHPIILHNLSSRTTYSKEDQLQQHLKLYHQDVKIEDVFYEMNKYILMQIKMLASDNIVKTIVHDFADKLSEINESNKRDFSI